MLRRERHRALHRRRGTTHHDLAGRVVVADDADLALGRRLGDRLGLREIGAEQRGHGAGTHRHRLLHGFAPQAQQARRIAQRQAARGGERRVLTQRMAGDEGRAIGQPPCALVLERANYRNRDRHERGLRVPRQREFALLAREHEPRERLAERLVHLLKHGAGSRKGIVQVLAHADLLRTLSGEDDGRRHPGDFRALASPICAPLLTTQPETCQANGPRHRLRCKNDDV